MDILQQQEESGIDKHGAYGREAGADTIKHFSRSIGHDIDFEVDKKKTGEEREACNPPGYMQVGHTATHIVINDSIEGHGAGMSPRRE